MRILKSLGVAVCTFMALAVFAAATPAQAQEPHYLHALSDLRTARDYIQYDRGQFHGERHHAVEEINKAIEEIKHAAWDDGKNTQFAPPAQGVTTGWAPIPMRSIGWRGPRVMWPRVLTPRKTRAFGTERFFTSRKRYVSLTSSASQAPTSSK
jgi:hypothetical protein